MINPVIECQKYFNAAFDSIAREKADQEPDTCIYIALCPNCKIMTKVIHKDLHEPGKYPGEQWEYGVPVYECCEGRVEG